ncbi:MAG: hypothetical protein AVDCRST_MAG88-271 [uncultured Thermomicrobiales bacterium]|uniref:Uncharacterized protein n=1 Tax=uncultured Thermomicrobiales bacterium TaxID=1645740 RepID=A0A6J4U9J3_9BACT|nr:MAG: hypothetical protein AVDCRST_MAG88-271 [uncultured Thermomicrobiales bacterium]
MGRQAGRETLQEQGDEPAGTLLPLVAVEHGNRARIAVGEERIACVEAVLEGGG